MTDAELVFTALAELSVRQIAETMESKGLKENKIPAKKGGRIAKNARLELEQKNRKEGYQRIELSSARTKTIDKMKPFPKPIKIKIIYDWELQKITKVGREEALFPRIPASLLGVCPKAPERVRGIKL